MSGIQEKITRRAKRQTNMTQSEEKNQLKEADAEMSQMQNEVNKNIKTANMISYHMFEKAEESTNMLRRDMDDTLKKLQRNL